MKTDHLFSDPFLAGIYDVWNPRKKRKDYDFYLGQILAADARPVIAAMPDGFAVLIPHRQCWNTHKDARILSGLPAICNRWTRLRNSI